VDGVDDDMVAVLRRAQVGPTMANPGLAHDTARLAEAIPGVLDTAEAFLELRREAWDEPLRAPVEEYKTRLGSWEQPTLAGGGSAPTVTRERLASLADSLLTTGRPMLRVLAVLAPATAHAA
jgi:hypothetical protein